MNAHAVALLSLQRIVRPMCMISANLRKCFCHAL